MTTEQLYYINSVSRGIGDIERLLDNPGHLRIVKNSDRSCYFDADGYFSINKNVTKRIGNILENAQEEIKSILEQELTTLKAEFERIVVQTPNTFNNENN